MELSVCTIPLSMLLGALSSEPYIMALASPLWMGDCTPPNMLLLVLNETSPSSSSRIV